MQTTCFLPRKLGVHYLGHNLFIERGLHREGLAERDTACGLRPQKALFSLKVPREHRCFGRNCTTTDRDWRSCAAGHYTAGAAIYHAHLHLPKTKEQKTCCRTRQGDRSTRPQLQHTTTTTTTTAARAAAVAVAAAAVSPAAAVQ